MRPLPAIWIALTFALLTGAASQAPAQRVAWQSDVYPRPAYQISGTCSMEMSPDRAVIVGGVSSSALKPTDAIDQLEKQLDLMKDYAKQQHGDIQLLERVRTLKTPQPGREDTELPFQVIQRLQITFPANAPVDAILDKLIGLGLDRFGENIFNNYGNRREAVVRFRVSNFDAKMEDFQQHCTADAWKQWCASQASGENCKSLTPPSDLDLQMFNLHSQETLMRPDGSSGLWQMQINRMQRSPEPPDLLGDVTVHLEGNIVLTYRPPAAPAQP
jgi:Protein of unknown function (DUF541)